MIVKEVLTTLVKYHKPNDACCSSFTAPPGPSLKLPHYAPSQAQQKVPSEDGDRNIGIVYSL
jgi:hypothetical protein